MEPAVDADDREASAGKTEGGFLRPLGVARGWEAKGLVAVVLLALAVRAAWALATRSWVFGNDWAFGYEMGEIASHLASGRGFRLAWSSVQPPQPSAWVPPLYPFLIAGVFESFGIFSRNSAVVIQLFQSLISALTCVALYALGKRLYGARVGLVAALLLAVYPAAVYFSVQKIWSTGLFAFSVVAVLLMLLQLIDRPRPGRGLALGSVLGLTALLDPVILGMLPYTFLRLWRDGAGHRRDVAKTIAAILVAAGIVVSPWLVRNYVVFDRLVFLKSNFGHELYAGNNPAADGFWNPRLENELNGAIATPLLTRAERATLLRADEAVANKLYLRKGLDFIVSHPVQFLHLTVRRMGLFWTRLRPVRGWADEAWTVLGLATLALAAAGLLLGGPRRRERSFVVCCLLWLPVTYYLTLVGLSRYRFPVEPVVLVFVAHALFRAGSRWRERLPRRVRPLFR
jgi:4-amino-4-deoxy-L-arabinose transferase-like glycosyltransferase